MTAGPFPVCECPDGPEWFLPVPADVGFDTAGEGADRIARLVARPAVPMGGSSLPQPLCLAVAGLLPPAKERRSGGWTLAGSFGAYLNSENPSAMSQVEDAAFSDNEAQIGITIDPRTGTIGAGAAEGKIYSASYLRLRPFWALGLLSGKGGDDDRVDWTTRLFDNSGHIVVGGQQRLCSVELRPKAAAPLPLGVQSFEPGADGRCRVKWILLTPALWPQTDGGKIVVRHPGGWLPNWVHPETGDVLLTHGIGRNKAERLRRHGRTVHEPEPIRARLLAALTGKPLPVTGGSLGLAATEARNASILAHGCLPVGEENFNRLRDLAADFLGLDLAAERYPLPAPDPQWLIT